MKKILLSIAILSICLVALGALTACSPAPTGIAVIVSPTARTVPQGMTPDLSGGLVRVSYEDGTTKDLSMTELEQRGFNSATLGKQTLVLVYTEGKKTFSATVELTVQLPKANRLELTTEQVKKEYFVGEYFDRTGLVVTAYYETGAVAETTNYEVTPNTQLTVGTTKVTVTHRGASAEIPITVSERAVKSLEITTPPEKASYFVGDSFRPDGLVATATYNDGKTETFGASVLTFEHLFGGEYLTPISAEDNRVLVTARTALGNVSCELTLLVEKILPVRMTATVKGDPLTFVEGTSFSFGSEGKVSIEILYNNGAPQTVTATDDLFRDEGDLLVMGQKNVEVRMGEYAEVKAVIPITVVEATPISFEVLLRPDKIDYAVGETVDLTGLILLVKLNNGLIEQVAYSPESGITCTPAGALTAGRITVTVLYGGKSASFSVDVE